MLSPCTFTCSNVLASFLPGRLFTQLSVTLGWGQNLAPKWFQKLEPKLNRFQTIPGRLERLKRLEWLERLDR